MTVGMEFWMEALLRDHDVRMSIEYRAKDVSVQAFCTRSAHRTDVLTGDISDLDNYIGQMLGELLVMRAKDLASRVRKGAEEAREGATTDLGDFGEYLGSNSNEMCRCGHAATAHTLGAGNCFALGLTPQEDSHCLEFCPPATPGDSVGEKIAYRIRAELVCCDIYGLIRDRKDLTEAGKTVLFRELTSSRDWHDLCYWGEAAARLAEDFRG